MGTSKAYKASVSRRRAAIAFLLFSTLALSFVPYILFHQHEAPSGFHCNENEPEFIIILQDRFANKDQTQSNNECSGHNSHFSVEGFNCDICDFIFTTSFLVRPLFENKALHTLNINEFAWSENIVTDRLHISLYNKGSPNC